MLKTAPEFIIKTVGDGAAPCYKHEFLGSRQTGRCCTVQSHLQLDLDQCNAMDEVSTGRNNHSFITSCIEASWQIARICFNAKLSPKT